MAQGKRKSNSNPIRIDTTTQGAQYQVWEEEIVLSLRRGSGWESEITAEFNLKEQNLGLNLAPGPTGRGEGSTDLQRETGNTKYLGTLLSTSSFILNGQAS